jgi:soluble lytic murein transglycosylase-like protein
VADVRRIIVDTAQVAFWALILLIVVVCCAALDTNAQIPDGAARYRHDYARIVRSEWGLSAPVASLAAQIHQESGWDCRAVSRVGARGCAQFMPTTAAWIGDVDHSLKAGDLHSPAWAFRAQAVYMKWLHARIKASDECNQMAFAMAAYNGGLGYVYRRQKVSRVPASAST